MESIVSIARIYNYISYCSQAEFKMQSEFFWDYTYDPKYFSFCISMKFSLGPFRFYFAANYYGMIDQLVASRGRLFFGCWFSTFTGYIMRIRGYHSIKDKAPGYEHGELPTTYYYVTKERLNEMHKYAPLRRNFYVREYPTSWRDIDQGIKELASISRHR